MKRLFAINKRPKDFDIIVVGSSLEGLACAKEAANLGASVCVVTDNLDITEQLEERTFLNLLYHAGMARTKLKEAENYGWSLGPCALKTVSLQQLYGARSQLKKYCQDRLNGFIDKSTVCYLQGDFKFVRNNPITIASSEAPEDEYTAEYFVLAPIGIYAFPDVSGASEHGLLPNDLLKMESIFGNILVIGDGSDALELASAFLQMGLKATILDRREKTHCFDDQMLTFYLETLSDEGLQMIPKTIIKMLEKTEDNKIRIHYITLGNEWQSSESFDYIVFVDERRTNLKSFMLNNIKLEAECNKIPTSNKFETKIPNIYAIGPVVEEQTHNTGVDIQAGKKLAELLVSVGPRRNHLLHYTDIVGVLRGPVVDYSFVGTTEESAYKLYGTKHIEVYHSFYKPTEYFVAKKKMDQCYLKIICLDDESGTIVGMHLLGPYSASIMQGYAAAIKCGLTYDNLIRSPGIFPTIAREFTLLTITKRSGLNPKPEACCS